jgi:cell division transport system ATP-binding protein
MIEFVDVEKRSPNGELRLAEINFQVATGELLVISGSAGAGKSTLLRLIPLIERPCAGTIRINGRNIVHLLRSAVPYLRRTMGLILPENHLLTDRNIFDNVLLPLAITDHAPQDAQRRVMAALERVGLAHRAKDNPATLSSGEQQCLAIARAIVNRPGILLADNPMAHLDAPHAKEIANLLRSFNEVGVTVIVATHDHALFPDAHHLRLHQGRLVQ